MNKAFNARRIENYVVVPYGGDSLANVEMGFGELNEVGWRSAFMSYTDGKTISAGDQRVVLLPAPPPRSQPYKVWVKIDGHPNFVGSVVIS